MPRMFLNSLLKSAAVVVSTYSGGRDFSSIVCVIEAEYIRRSSTSDLILIEQMVE